MRVYNTSRRIREGGIAGLSGGRDQNETYFMN